jgi:hypothetical protein
MWSMSILPGDLGAEHVVDRLAVRQPGQDVGHGERRDAVIGEVELKLERDDTHTDVNGGQQVGDLERLVDAVVGPDGGSERLLLIGVAQRDQIEIAAVRLGAQAIEDRQSVDLA